MIETSYSDARANLARYLDAAVQDHEVIRITRRRGGDTVLVDAREFESLQETAHLLQSPANALRLFASLERARHGEGTPMTLDALRREAGLAEEA
ncbi:MAG: type II toxin-antitoxin system Phd/YefM family antitoxin [Chloroflexota bacterium]